MSTLKRKTMIALIFVTVFTLNLTACALFFSPGQSSAVNIEGKTLKIELEENPSTGFSWNYTTSDENVIHLVEDTYLATSNDPDVVGGGGIHYFTFEGLEAGEVTLIFDYYKSWEGVESAEEHIEFVVTIKEDGTIVGVNQ